MCTLYTLSLKKGFTHLHPHSLRLLTLRPMHTLRTHIAPYTLHTYTMRSHTLRPILKFVPPHIAPPLLDTLHCHTMRPFNMSRTFYVPMLCDPTFCYTNKL